MKKVQIVDYINTNKDHFHGHKWNTCPLFTMTVLMTYWTRRFAGWVVLVCLPLPDAAYLQSTCYRTWPELPLWPTITHLNNERTHNSSTRHVLRLLSCSFLLYLNSDLRALYRQYPSRFDISSCTGRKEREIIGTARVRYGMFFLYSWHSARVFDL